MTGDVDRIPTVSTEWIAQPGDVRRATLSVLLQRGLWKRSLTVVGAVSVIFAGVCIATGSGWALGLAIFAALFVGYEALAVLLCMFGAYRQNRHSLRVGSQWAIGADDTRIRIETPTSTLIIRKGDVVSARRAGTLVVLKMRPKAAVGIPAALFAAPELADLITR